MNTHSAEETAALEILKSTGVNIIEAAMVAKITLEAGHGRVKRAIKCARLGEEELKRLNKTVTFEKAVEVALDARKERRARTLSDFRYVTRRFIKRCKGLAKRRLRSIRAEECAQYIEAAFSTPSQRAKARRILSGIRHSNKTWLVQRKPRTQSGDTRSAGKANRHSETAGD